MVVQAAVNEVPQSEAAAVPLIWWLFRGLRSERVGVPLASVSVACVAAVWVGSRLAA